VPLAQENTVNTELIIRAWKDPAFRASLTSEQREALPECPSGRPLTELGEDDLVDVVGGVSTIRPTPPVFPTQLRHCGTSAVDACPTARLCPTTTILL
jgi:mersacidin/lichenicidin family type 2 lantibiotic